MALEERELDVVCEEEELGWVGHGGCDDGRGLRREEVDWD